MLLVLETDLQLPVSLILQSKMFSSLFFSCLVKAIRIFQLF